MRPSAALAILVPSAAVIIVSAVAIRGRRRLLDEVPVAVGGAGLGLGALFLQADASTLAWWMTPPLVAVLAVAHVRALLAGEGPLRI